METSEQLNKSQHGKFWQGFIFSIYCWVLEAVIIVLISSLFQPSTHRAWVFDLWHAFAGTIIITGFLWIPVTIIASIKTSKKGIESIKKLIVVSFIFIPILEIIVIWLVYYSGGS